MAKQLANSRRNISTNGRRPSLRSLLILLVIATVVPIFLFSAWLAMLQSQREMDIIEENLLNTAQAIAIDVDREVISTIQSLQTLALGFDPDTARTKEFQELSNRLLSAQRAWKTVIVRDPSGKRLVTISRYTEEKNPASSVTSESLDIFKTEKDSGIDSPLAFLLGSSVGVHVPIRIGQKTAYLASVLLDPQIFAGLLTKHKVSADWLISILDSKNIVVASTRFADKFFGKPTQLFLQEPGHVTPGHLFRSKIDDVPSYVVLSAAPVSRWSVALAVPAGVIEAPYYRSLWVIIGVGFLCLIVGVALAYLIGRKVARPFERLASQAKDRALGNAVAGPSNGSLAEVEVINEAFDQSANLLKEREQERNYFGEQLDVRLNDLTGLHKLTTGLLAIAEREALYNEIVTGALILFRAEKGSLHLADQKTQQLEVAAQIGFANDDAQRFHSPASAVMATRRPVVIEDFERSSVLDDQQHRAASEPAIRAVVSFPLTQHRGDIIGALSTYFSQPCKPTPWQEILFDLYAQYCVNMIEQTKAKEELRALNNGLEERVKDHAKRLEEAYLQRLHDLTKQKELEKGLREAQKMELVGTLAGGIAHDFNNILNIIQSYVSSLDLKNENEAIEHVGAIKETVQRGASVVRQLLAVARKSEAKFEAADLNDLIRALMDLLAKTFPKNIIVAAEFDPKIPRVMLDSNQISQAVINLCVNARDAMPSGGKLSIRTQFLDATTATQRWAGAKEIAYGCVSVFDTGAGIQNEAREHIFEPFFTTKGPGRGNGLGLSVVYGIMQAHDGFVDFESEPGRGTSFYLCFPIREATGAASAEKDFPEAGFPSSPHGATILIVEDEPNQVILLRKVFEKNGYTVFTASEGETALEILNHHRHEIAAVLLDIGLPGTNGYDVFHKMRDINPKVKVVFATGYVLPQLDLDNLEKESYGVVMKPYDLSEVLKKVAVAIGTERP